MQELGVKQVAVAGGGADLNDFATHIFALSVIVPIPRSFPKRFPNQTAHIEVNRNSYPRILEIRSIQRRKEKLREGTPLARAK